MSRLRQVIRSRLEKGGSLVTFWRANTHISRRDLLIWYPPSRRMKNRDKRSAETSDTAAAGYKPRRARSRACSLISVAKIWTALVVTGPVAILRAFSQRNSSRQIAMEYASSPVEQPGIQIRIGFSSSLRD